MRILDKKSGQISLDRIGLQAEMRQALEELIHQPYGMVLVCGPTGSGKTTTLYAGLNALNSADRNIMTIEDPVEYQLDGIVQGNVNPKAGITFATGLRSLVRQDPDIILVGEIRDQETARIAIEAALTGHLVFSSIHANDAAGAITRLADMGVEPFFIASAILGTLAQRLLRLVCPKCGEPSTPQPALLASLGERFAREAADIAFRQGAGCEFCHRSGYKGRTGIYELLSINSETKRLILAQASPTEISQAGLLKGRTMRDDALFKLRQGLTTPEEVLRVTMM
jgi:type II secretory ATPase GspE/PulE/Tfp pilus assembly ATPase PilB-like protein